MRIRSIKPEFWRDETIVSLPITTRLTFIGLWSYVDDNGVGDARVSSIVGDLYADDMSRDPRETLARVAGDIRALSDARLIVVYNDPEHPRRELIYIRNWKRHQKIDRPSKGNQYPLPSAETLESANTRDTLATPSRVSRANSAPGAGEQGNRGTGEQGNPPAVHKSAQGGDSAATRETRTEVRLRALNSTARSSEADQVASAYRAWAGGTIPSQTLIEVAQEVDQLIADGIPAHQIADGIKAWHGSDRLYASQLPHFVAKAARPTDTTTKATHRAVDTLTQAEQIIAELETA